MANIGQAMVSGGTSVSVINQRKPATKAAALVHHRRVDVETRQAQRSTGAVDKGCDPPPPTQSFQRPFVGNQRRGSAKGHHVSQRIHLLAKGALRVGHARHAAVQAVEHHGAKHTDGSLIKPVVHGHHNGIKTTKERCQREEIGQHVDALAQPGGHLIGLGARIVSHERAAFDILTG
jgi:hypothetical protein